MNEDLLDNMDLEVEKDSKRHLSKISYYLVGTFILIGIGLLIILLTQSAERFGATLC